MSWGLALLFISAFLVCCATISMAMESEYDVFYLWLATITALWSIRAKIRRDE